MKIVQSTIFDPQLAATDGPRLGFYGDADDHLRFPALFTLASRQRWGVASGDACLDPTASWTQRSDALLDVLAESRERLRRLPREQAQPLIIENLDALSFGQQDEPSPDEPPDHAAKPTLAWTRLGFERERRSLLNALTYNTGGLPLVVQIGERPPRGLDDSLVAAVETADQALSALLVDVPLAVRRLVAGLIATRRANLVNVQQMIDACEPQKLTEYLLWRSYSRLEDETRCALRALATQRGPQHYNGVIGAFRINDAEVTRSAAQELISTGWLVHIGSSVEIPWLLRRYVLSQLDLLTPERREPLFTLLTDAIPTDTQDPALHTELHHRAREAGNIALAWETARFYVSDMRSLARRLSDAREFSSSAEIYDRIVTTFDPHDSYSWEYLAYNLERVSRRPQHKDRITFAYQRAHELTNARNALYWARWLCWRMKSDLISFDEARVEFRDALNILKDLSFSDSLERFARPVLKTLRQLARQDLWADWIKGWELRLAKLEAEG